MMPSQHLLAQEEMCETSTGTQLFVRRVDAHPGHQLGNCLIVHGGCDHGGRYLPLAQRLAQAGWNCLIPDLRGHGRSGGPRMDVADFQSYLDDLHGVVMQSGKRYPDVMWGHSLGGLLSLLFISQSPQPPRALVLSSPLIRLQLKVPAWKRLLGHALRPMWPSLKLPTGLDPRNMLIDEELRARRRADPWLQKRVTLRWFFALQRVLADFHRKPPNVSCPVLLVLGENDRTIDNQGAEQYVNTLLHPHNETWVLPGQVHEWVHDQKGPEVIERIIIWLDRVVAST